MAGGTAVAVHYHALGLTLSHYDARGHLVVARRVADSITPGWQQIGAVWLPLPHILNAVPVQLDAFYRTGASGVAISVLAFALAAVSIAAIVRELSGSAVAAAAAAAAFALNPNVLYLQATPMTEPLLLGLATLGVALLIAAVRRTERQEGGAGPQVRASWIGTVFALACLTRYEAWPITACALAFAAWARRRAGDRWREAFHFASSIGRYPALAIVAFMVFSRIVIGEWFVSSEFFVPDNPAHGHPVTAAGQITWGARMLSGTTLAAVAAAGLSTLAARGLLIRHHASNLVALALAASAALPWLAFLEGHPFRIRYMVPLIAAEAVAAGVIVGLSKRAAPAAAVVLLSLVLFEQGPLDQRASMIAEAQWDVPIAARRRPVGDYLRSAYDGQTIMASMGSLGHYMQELSHDGFDIRDFLHEGNGDIWLRALEGPRPFVGWILVEEAAEGGDMLATIARANPEFLHGFSRVSEGGGLALYVRQNRILNVAR